MQAQLFHARMQRMLRPLAAALLVAGVATAFAQAQPQASRARSSTVEIDGIAAIVNAEAITRGEFAARLNAVRNQLEARRVESPPLDVLAAQVLERMILDRAQLQRARELGLRVDDFQLDRVIAGMAAERGLTADGFRRGVEADGLTMAQFRDQLRTELLQTRLREREVESRVQVSESDIDAFIAERERGRADAALEFNLAQILVRVAEAASAEEIARRRARAEEVLAAARRPGADFAALAAAWSDASDAMTGGSLGWRTTDRLPQLFVEAVREQPEGAVVLARSPNGFHVIRVAGRRSGQAAADGSGPIPQVRVRHLLIRVGGEMGEPQALRRIQEIRTQIASKRVDFASAAKAFSDDGSSGRGGDLGWILPGDTVPEFERALEALQPGQLSAPVRTPFGVHLIEVLERRVAAAPPERLRNAARQALREQRVDEAWQDWLRQLRDRTYVEIRLDER
jgi:peptidyl-prolyl cis-trans isomerase SurA